MIKADNEDNKMRTILLKAALSSNGQAQRSCATLACVSSGVQVPVMASQTPCRVSSVEPPAEYRRAKRTMEVKRTQRTLQAVRGTVIP